MKKKRKLDSSILYSSFLSDNYQKHNIARLSHLDSLGFEFAGKSVIEFGAGIGDHTYYYLTRRAKVLPTDGRPELVDFIKKRFGIHAEIIDAEKDLDKIRNLPHFDIAHCYGFLYHINNPSEFLDALKGKCSLLFLETCVSPDGFEDGIYLISENKNDLTQAISNKGCRPTRNWIFEKLKQQFPFVYTPFYQPNHPEFPLEFSEKSYEPDLLMRAIFIASDHQLYNDRLLNYLPRCYEVQK